MEGSGDVVSTVGMATDQEMTIVVGTEVTIVVVRAVVVMEEAGVIEGDTEAGERGIRADGAVVTGGEVDSSRIRNNSSHKLRASRAKGVSNLAISGDSCRRQETFPLSYDFSGFAHHDLKFS